MSVSLSKRWIALAVGLMVAAAAGAVAVSALPSASAQEPSPSATFVISNLPVSASNGFSNLPEFSGSGDGVLGAACTGAAPRGGSANVPAQIVTELRTDLTYLRILRSNGHAITGTVRINCVLEVELTPVGNATIERLQQAGARAR